MGDVMCTAGWSGFNLPAGFGTGVAHLVLCGSRLGLFCLQAGDYPPESTGLERRS